MSTTFAIASPFGSQLCYDYVIYRSLREAMERAGYIYDENSRNKIILLGYPQRHDYLECGPIRDDDFKIGLIGSGLPMVSNLGKLDKVFVSSPAAYHYCCSNMHRKPDGIWNLYSPHGNALLPDFLLTQEYIPIRQVDIAFVGNARPRPAVECLMNEIHKMPNVTFDYYGANINNYMGTAKAKEYWTGTPLPYHQFPELALKAKIVLMDMHDHMTALEMPSFKLIDMLMSKAFVLTYENRYVRDYLGGVYFTRRNLISMLGTYLDNEEARKEVVSRTYNRVKETHNMKQIVALLSGLLAVHGIVDL